MPNPEELEQLQRLADKVREWERDKKIELLTTPAEHKPRPSKPILCLDFDGVLHSYVSGWQGADVIPDLPVVGAMEFIDKAKEHFDIQIFSSRSSTAAGRDAMWRWLCEHWTKYVFETRPELKEKFSFVEPSFIGLPENKPAAFIGIDDRVLTFTGVFPDIESLRKFKPWNK